MNRRFPLSNFQDHRAAVAAHWRQTGENSWRTARQRLDLRFRQRATVEPHFTNLAREKVLLAGADPERLIGREALVPRLK